MDAYRSYMDQITVSPAQHEALMAALTGARGRARSPWVKYGALAACCALVLLAAWGALREAEPPSLSSDGPPGTKDTYGPGETEPPHTAAPGLVFTDRTKEPAFAASIAVPEGSFSEPLTGAECLALLGIEAPAAWTAEPFEVGGEAVYDGTGALWQVWVRGVSGRDAERTFVLTLAPGALPPDCVVFEGGADNVVEGVSVHADKWVYDRDGDGADEYVYKAAFLAGDAGVRLEVVGTDADAETLASQTVRAVLTGTGVGLSALVPAEIPEWRSEFLTLDAARAEPELGRYIPAGGPAGFAFAEAFRELGQGRDWLSARWERGYDYVDLRVFRPFEALPVTDVNAPERYDVNRYEIPWADSVPEEYREAFDDPVFRAEDVTPAVLAARLRYVPGDGGDSAGYRGRFTVLYPDGLAVEYTLKGVTPAQAAALLGLDR